MEDINAQVEDHETADSAYSGEYSEEVVNENPDITDQKENKIVNEQEQNRPVNPGDQAFPDKEITSNNEGETDSNNRNEDNDNDDLNEGGDDHPAEPEVDDPYKKEGGSAEKTERKIPDM